MRPKGVTLKGVLVIVAVVVATLAILGLVKRAVSENRDEMTDARKMRKIYVALSVYEGLNENYPPPDLLTLRTTLSDDTLYWAQNDPHLKGNDFPIDPAATTSRKRSPTRISFTYFPLWKKRLTIDSFMALQQNVQAGILASYWYGDIDSRSPDGRGCTGPVVRINMDGSVYRLAERSDKSQLTEKDLFSLRNP